MPCVSEKGYMLFAGKPDDGAQTMVSQSTDQPAGWDGVVSH
jgi:hypothetical protein